MAAETDPNAKPQTLSPLWLLISWYHAIEGKKIIRISSPEEGGNCMKPAESFTSR